MGNVFSFLKSGQNHNHNLYVRRPSSNSNADLIRQPLSPHRPLGPTTTAMSKAKEVSKSRNRSQSRRSNSVKDKYSFIADNFSSLDQVTLALREAGLESSNLILGIDFTKSNEWTGRVSFRNRSLHSIGDSPNPYESAISVIGKTMASFDEDDLIPCFGFGDATTHDQEVLSFHHDRSPCHGFEEALACYRKIVPHLRLAGPTSYAPVIEAAMDIVDRSGGQFHVLVIIADGQVTRSVNTSDGELSPQEEQTISSIASASAYPLSIVLVGVGDGPWDDMKKFDDKIPRRNFDNFQFVNFTDIMSKSGITEQAKETSFALAALMEIPFQYKAAIELGLLGHVTGTAKRVVPRPPPIPHAPRRIPSNEQVRNSSSATNSAYDQNQSCAVCLTNSRDMAFGCGHMVSVLETEIGPFWLLHDRLSSLAMHNNVIMKEGRNCRPAENVDRACKTAPYAANRSAAAFVCTHDRFVTPPMQFNSIQCL